MLSGTELKGLYAIMPTPAKPGAQRLDATGTVDLDETARVVEALIRDGVSGLIALGTTGECATLSRPDYDAFATCVLEVTARRVPTFIGASALGGHEVASRLAFLRSRGADGTLMGLPMWQPVSTGMAVDFFRQISEFAPGLAVMAYANQRAFRYGFPAEFWEQVAAVAPTVVSAKMSRPKDLPDLLRRTGGRINFMPNETTLQHVHAQAPEAVTACWATAASMGPRPALMLVDAVLRADAARADQLVARIAWANEPVRDIIKDPELFAMTNIQVEKARIDAAGYCRAGPVRPPYDELAPEHMAAAKECGRRWAALCVELDAASAIARPAA